jgi:tetratricopeptide (TPR) repeat protein
MVIVFKQKQLRNTRKNTFIVVTCSITFLLITGCGSQKETVATRGMQNLTARYNILYNAKELVNESERNINLAYQDNFGNFIPVFKEPDETLSQPELKKLDDAILKANTIVNEKFQSKFVDDAYFLIAKANHLKSNFFNATEYFTYVYNSYPKEKELKQAALAYKVRSLISSDRFEEAESTLDTAFKYIESEKKSVADLYAIRSQMLIFSRKDEEAISFLEKAIKLSKNKENKIRWTFLLAQLQDNTGKTDEALSNYSKIVKSNAPFNMAFNALLNSITIKDEKTGKKTDRAEQLNSLLKDDKNRDFRDQIYYEIANSYADENNIDKAIENYNLAVRRESRNQNQKGLSYLKLADIYLKQSDFIKAKNYYDSTLTSLSPQYPDYELIQKKGSNLALLANRLSIIAQEDTLQMLANLPEAERKERVGILVREQAQKSLSPAAAAQTDAFFNNSQPFGNSKDNKFYFNNPTALSQGFSDFKRKWGNRKLEDNWRRSQKSSSDIANSGADNNNFSGNMIPDNPDAVALTPQDIQKTFTDSIPLTAVQKSASDQKIASAYYDIGNYYREVLNDQAEAIRNYETLIKRFPVSNFKLPVYYNLYRLYAETDPEKSAYYKNILLKEHPETPFAKIILDPSFNQKVDVREVELTKFYNETYRQYESKNYKEVISRAAEAEKNFGRNHLSAQSAYLNALAIGHTQKLAALDTAFQQIVRNYPEDKLIVPLVQQHLLYLQTNKDLINKRIFALVDEDPNEPRFVEEPRTEPVQQTLIAKNTDVKSKPAITTEDKVNPQQNNTDKASVPIPTESGFFSMADSAEYYFVVNILDPSVNLSSSRFGIGQFNRANFSGNGIKHQLKAVNRQNQLIFVGVFNSKNAVVDYYKNINPLMKDIMKIPADKYNTFFISKQNLDKLNNRDMVDQYIDFYQKNF